MKLTQLLQYIVYASLVSVVLNACAQSNTTMKTLSEESTLIPFDSNRWSFKGDYQVEQYLGENALNLGAITSENPGPGGGFGTATVTDMEFHNGIIEYDVVFDEARAFAGLKFRVQEDSKFEAFYMRAHLSGKPDASQYMTVYNGIDSWQLDYGEQYSAPLKHDFNKWTHVKVVVSNKLADIYVKNMETPALTVALSSATDIGQVGMWGRNIGGDVRFANYSVKKMEEPEIKGTPIPEKPASKGSVLSWSVSSAFAEQSLLGKVMLSEADKAGLTFQSLQSEPRGITNLAKLQGLAVGKDTVFAKVKISSDQDQIKKLDLGFSDKVKVYLNNQILFEGSDLYMSRDYRFLGTVGFYDSVYLPLKKGNNELLFAVTASAKAPTGGWAIQARFENLDGISLKD